MLGFFRVVVVEDGGGAFATFWLAMTVEFEFVALEVAAETAFQPMVPVLCLLC